MTYRVMLHPKAADFLKRLDEKKRDEIRKKLGVLKERPDTGKHLKHSGFWSLRIGDHRAIYEIDRERNEVIVLFIGHRKDVYGDFSKLF